MKRIAVMQPYFFPYLGYYQLFNCVDEFIFFDDANFFKKGFINNNYFVLSGIKTKFTIPIKNASQNRSINQHEYIKDRLIKKFLKSVYLNYKESKKFQCIFNIINQIFDTDNLNVADLNITTITKIFQYLNINKKFFKSSDILPKGQYKNKTWIAEICKVREGTTYINSFGGRRLYKADFFKSYDLDLEFLKPNFSKYMQFSKAFIPSLSMIDVLMHNSKEEVRKLLIDCIIEK